MCRFFCVLSDIAVVFEQVVIIYTIESSFEVDKIWQDVSTPFGSEGCLTWKDFKTIQKDMSDIHSSQRLTLIGKTPWKPGWLDEKVNGRLAGGLIICASHFQY